MQRFVFLIDRINDHIGRAMGWVMFALVMLVAVDVISRYLFNTGAVVIQEAEWWMFSIIFLMCAGYTFIYDEHVRVDLVYSHLTGKWKNIVDITCAFLFLFPMCLLLILTSLWFIQESWSVREFSPDPGGLCCYYLLKAIIPLGFFLLFLQGIVNVYRKIMDLRGLEILPPPEDKLSARSRVATVKDIDINGG